MKMNSVGDIQGDASSGNEKSMPKDAQVIISIIKDLGFQDYEPRQKVFYEFRIVINAHNYCSIEKFLQGCQHSP